MSKRSLSLALIIGLSLTACAEDTAPKTAPLACGITGSGPLALAVGSHANAPAPKIDAALTDLVRETVKAGHMFSLIRIDGASKVAFSEQFASDAGNDVALNDDVDTYVTKVEQAIETDVRAQAPEVDVLTALTHAAANTAPGGNVVLIDSGLQTKAPLDFREMIDAEPADVVEQLRRQQLIPDLKGRKVLLSGLGYVASPQREPDLRLQRNIIAIWTEIAEAGGASCVAPDPRVKPEPAPEGVPAVSVVPLPTTPVTFSPCRQSDLNDGNNVGFVRGTATFREPGPARATLTKLADTISKDHLRVKLLGSTSSEGEPETNLRLSQDRAEAVKRELVALGAPEGSITTEGRGEQWKGRVDDTAPDGTLLPGPAARNRKVIAELTCPST